eukprot:539508-Amphidinium_carterae.1
MGLPFRPDETMAANLQGVWSQLPPRQSNPRGNASARRNEQELQPLRVGTSSKASSAAGPSKGKGKNKTKTGIDRNGRQICDSWNNANGQCANIKSGALCPAGRAHVRLKCGSSDHPGCEPAHACV